MNANDYQAAARRTLIDAPDHNFSGNDLMLMWCTLGLTGESGEVAEHIKKAICHQHGLDRDKLIKELGDVLWYVAGIASLIDAPLAEIMRRNIDKLTQRYPNGYSSADSKARVDTRLKMLCWNCGQPIDNLTGHWIMRETNPDVDFLQVDIGECCHARMVNAGFIVVAQAK